MDVTGLGSWPGTDFAAAQRLTFGEFERFPYFVELPERGVGAGMIGRATAVVSGLDFDLQPAGWRLTDGSGVDHRRAVSLLRRDLDDLEEISQGYQGRFKVQVTGPWTLAANVEKPRGDKVLADHGARRDLTDALAEGVAELLGALRRRMPGAELVLQLDEPSLPSVARGAVATASGFSKHRTVQPPELSAALETVIGAAGVPVLVHCCAPGLPIELVGKAGADGLALDVDQLDGAARDALGSALDGGTQLLLGVGQTSTPGVLPGPDRLAQRALDILRPWELDPAVTAAVTLTPACGLAGWTQSDALTLVRSLVGAAGIAGDELQR